MLRRILAILLILAFASACKTSTGSYIGGFTLLGVGAAGGAATLGYVAEVEGRNDARQVVADAFGVQPAVKENVNGGAVAIMSVFSLGLIIGGIAMIVRASNQAEAEHRKVLEDAHKMGRVFRRRSDARPPTRDPAAEAPMMTETSSTTTPMRPVFQAAE